MSSTNFVFFFVDTHLLQDENNNSWLALKKNMVRTFFSFFGYTLPFLFGFSAPLTRADARQIYFIRGKHHVCRQQLFRIAQKGGYLV